MANVRPKIHRLLEQAWDPEYNYSDDMWAVMDENNKVCMGNSAVKELFQYLTGENMIGYQFTNYVEEGHLKNKTCWQKMNHIDPLTGLHYIAFIRLIFNGKCDAKNFVGTIGCLHMAGNDHLSISPEIQQMRLNQMRGLECPAPDNVGMADAIANRRYCPLYAASDNVVYVDFGMTTGMTTSKET